MNASQRAALRSSFVTNVSGPASWTIGVWPFDETTAMLTLHSAHRPDFTITESLVDEWADATAASTFQRVRTSAIGPASADALLNLGFAVRQELDFLVTDLVTDRAGRRARRWHVGRVRPTDAVRIDVAAFGDEWALDLAAFENSCRATQDFRVRGVRSTMLGSLGAPLVRAAGYCLTGVSEDTSYLQRLAVVPVAQRRGAAGALIADAMRWAAQRGARRMFVNTDVGNAGALSLYGQWGFEPVGYRLRVMECDRRTLVSRRGRG